MKRLTCLMIWLAVAPLAAQEVRLDFLFTVPSPPNVENFGYSVALLDDTNGDGFPEFAVAASSAADGVIFLVSSLDGSLLGQFPSPQPASPAGFDTLDVGAVDQLFGRSMSFVPDANGDGIGDLAVGAAHHSTPGAAAIDGFAGVVYLVDPTNMSLIRTLSSPSPKAFGLFGFSLDGFWEGAGRSFSGLIVGAPGEDGVPDPPFTNVESGRAYIFDVTDGSLQTTFINPTETAGDEATEGRFGFAVGGTSQTDVDFFISEPGADFSATTLGNSGRVYQFQGVGSGVRTVNNGTINPLVPVTDGRFGEALAAMHPEAVVVGQPDSFPEDLSQNFGNFEFPFSGSRSRIFSPSPQANAGFGSSVAGILDISGTSGTGNAVVGEPRRGTPESEPLTDLAGFAHVYRPSDNLVVTLPRPGEPQTRAHFGASISGTRFLHQADPRARLIIGAPGAGILSPAAPVVYVYKMRFRLRGDLNKNFIVDGVDVDLMRRVLDGSISSTNFTNEIRETVDVNNDGTVDPLDFLVLDGIVNGNTNEEVVLELLTGTGQPFEGETDPAIIGFEGNSDFDDSTNVFELWRGTDPSKSDAGAPLPQTEVVQVNGANRGSVIVDVSAAIDDLLNVVAAFSFDHTNWRTSTDRVVLSESNGRRVIRFTDVVDLPDGSGLFARFSVDPATGP